jgi:hypothetical protein
MNKQTATVYCYHCRTYHPRLEMKLVVTKTGKRWRCYQSIEAAKVSREKREEFGRQVTEANKAEAQKRQLRSLPNALRAESLV